MHSPGTRVVIFLMGQESLKLHQNWEMSLYSVDLIPIYTDYSTVKHDVTLVGVKQKRQTI